MSFYHTVDGFCTYTLFVVFSYCWCNPSAQTKHSLCVHVIYSVSSQRWCCETNAVTVCARYLLCFLTALVLSDKCSHCTCTIFALFPHNVGIVKRKLSLYMLVMCFKLVLLDKPVTVCARYLLCPLTTLVYLVGSYEGSRTLSFVPPLPRRIDCV